MVRNCSPVIMVKFGNTDNYKCWQEYGTTGTLSFLVGILNGTDTLEDSLAVSSITKHLP
jgi:hypothetical protein